MRNPLYKAIPKDIEDRKHFADGYATGSLWKKDKTTYCFKEDYDKDPDNSEYYIAFDEMVDWGLPNRHLIVDVIPETICEVVAGLSGTVEVNGKKLKRQLFEGDIVNILRTGNLYLTDYVIQYSESHLGWVAVPVSNREATPTKLDTGWQYEYKGNVNDKYLIDVI